MRATVDRIEGGIAVLVTRTDPPKRMTMPSNLLPAGSREGDIVTIAIDTDPQAAKAAREGVSQMIERLKKKGAGPS